MTALVVSFLAYQGAHDKAGEVTANELREWAMQHKSIAGMFPPAKSVHSPRILGFLPSPAVNYRPTGSNCIVYYSQWPLGPKYGLDCSTGRWQVLSS
jgi:hypothetical protein